MGRPKKVHSLVWRGEVLRSPKDIVLVLHPSQDPDRRCLFIVSPTNAKRLQRYLDELLKVDAMI